MVHAATARFADRATLAQDRRARSAAITLTTPHRYVLLPNALISAFAHDPLAVGVYVAIARLAMAAKGAVPLAARDLAAWMGSEQEADRAAIMRRIVKLEQSGWISITRSATGKHQLLPTWGRDQRDAPRPWQFEQTNCARPLHLRGRRVPIALLDDYVGRLEPKPRQGRALISRYLARPLLDLTDIGVYAIGLHVEIAPTPRLRHVGLWNASGMAALADTAVLLAQSLAGALTIVECDKIIQVGLSTHGYARLGRAAPAAQLQGELAKCRSAGSAAGSAAGSRGPHDQTAGYADQDGLNPVSTAPAALIAWDVGMSHESINHDSTAASPQEVGGLSARLVRQQLAEQAVAWLCQPPQFPHWSSTGADETGCRSLDQSIMIGHQRLNPARPILAGEWSELLALQAAHGVEQMLIWQARASRANKARPFGVTPAYYQACATRPQAAPERSHAETSTVLTGRRKRPTGKQRTAAAHDPEREALLREMGVRERRQLEAVSHTLIAAWAEALKHPGLAARFDSPIGFAVQQMRQGCAPPPQAELDRWTERARRRADPYDTWRHLEPAACEQEASAHERRLEARVRAIAPADADAGVLCRLADWIEQGATETEALAHLLLPNSGGAG